MRNSKISGAQATLLRTIGESGGKTQANVLQSQLRRVNRAEEKGEEIVETAADNSGMQEHI